MAAVSMKGSAKDVADGMSSKTLQVPLLLLLGFAACAKLFFGRCDTIQA